MSVCIKKQYFGSCVGNPFGSLWKLEFITDNARGITRETFFKHCDIEPEIELQMRRFPNDYEYYKSYEGIYFYTWSAIEYFFK